jgi:hypothetical protein
VRVPATNIILDHRSRRNALTLPSPGGRGFR